MSPKHLAMPEREQANKIIHNNAKIQIEGKPTGQVWTKWAEKLLRTVIKCQPLGKRRATYESILVINRDK